MDSVYFVTDNELLADPTNPRRPCVVGTARAMSANLVARWLMCIRPEYVDPVDRFAYRPGEIAQCDLWFPSLGDIVGSLRILGANRVGFDRCGRLLVAGVSSWALWQHDEQHDDDGRDDRRSQWAA